MYEHKPHVGTDKLRAMVQGLSRRIAELGGSVRYDAHVVDLDIKNNAVQGVILDGGERLAAGAVYWPAVTARAIPTLCWHAGA